MRFLVTGAGGQLGHDLLQLLAANPSHEAVGLTRAELDVGLPSAVEKVFEAHAPDVVINAAAWTDVDGAESDEPAATRVNAIGPAGLAAMCARTRATLIHLSTDYVFDGNSTRPYAEDAPRRPTSAYGRSKAFGEAAVLDRHTGAYVVRTAWLYGAHGRNFVRTMAKLARGDGDVRVVDDQRGSPTWTWDLAAGLVALAQARPEPGIYHATNAGDVTWYGFAREIFAVLGSDPQRVLPVTTAEFPRPAARPSYSVLSNARWNAAGLPPLRPWREALLAAIAAGIVAD